MIAIQGSGKRLNAKVDVGKSAMFSIRHIWTMMLSNQDIFVLPPKQPQNQPYDLTNTLCKPFAALFPFSIQIHRCVESLRQTALELLRSGASVSPRDECEKLATLVSHHPALADFTTFMDEVILAAGGSIFDHPLLSLFHVSAKVHLLSESASKMTHFVTARWNARVICSNAT